MFIRYNFLAWFCTVSSNGGFADTMCPATGNCIGRSSSSQGTPFFRGARAEPTVSGVCVYKLQTNGHSNGKCVLREVHMHHYI